MRALEPDRVLLLPDGDEDLWNDDYADLVVASPDAVYCAEYGARHTVGLRA